MAFTPTAPTTETVLGFLSSLFSRYGIPESVVTDNGPQFTSTAFSAFLKDRGITHIHSSVYHPSSNGAIERFKQVFKACVQSAILQNKRWKPATTEFLQAYRATPHAMTDASPFELMHGRKMKTKLNVLAPPTVTAQDDQVRSRVSLRQSHMKQYCDARQGARTPSFKEGDSVRVCKPVHVPKGHPKFSTPIKIKKQVAPSTYILEDGKTWHASHLASVPANNTESPDHPETGLEEPAEPRHDQNAGDRPARAHKPPDWLKDYET